MPKGFKLFIYFLFIACTVIFAITLFTSIFGDMGEDSIVIFVIICAFLTGAVYDFLEGD